jgi:hypothetical protein
MFLFVFDDCMIVFIRNGGMWPESRESVMSRESGGRSGRGITSGLRRKFQLLDFAVFFCVFFSFV